MSLSARPLRQESQNNRFERSEMRHEMFIVRGNLDIAFQDIFNLKNRTSSLERENISLWRIIYALIIGYVFILIVIIYLYFMINKH